MFDFIGWLRGPLSWAYLVFAVGFIALGVYKLLLLVLQVARRLLMSTDRRRSSWIPDISDHDFGDDPSGQFMARYNVVFRVAASTIACVLSIKFGIWLL